MQLLTNAAGKMTDKEFESVSELIKSLCGINLHTGKKELVKARLGKRLRQLGMPNITTYLDYVRNDETGGELTTMLDSLSTNLTSFFRENAHFEFLSKSVLPELIKKGNGKGRSIRIWSAGCSSGEEPYTLAIVLQEALSHLHGWDKRVLATDLSTRVLAKAKQGLYPEDRIEPIGASHRNKYFYKTGGKNDRMYQVRDELRELVTFARLNLMESWPMRGPFDVIFCRNVMIYFDKPTQSRLVNRFWELLGIGGMLFVGHSESLAGVKHPFEYVRPTIYKKR